MKSQVITDSSKLNLLPPAGSMLKALKEFNVQSFFKITSVQRPDLKSLISDAIKLALRAFWSLHGLLLVGNKICTLTL